MNSTYAKCRSVFAKWYLYKKEYGCRVVCRKWCPEKKPSRCLNWSYSVKIIIWEAFTKCFWRVEKSPRPYDRRTHTGQSAVISTPFGRSRITIFPSGRTTKNAHLHSSMNLPWNRNPSFRNVSGSDASGLLATLAFSRSVALAVHSLV